MAAEHGESLKELIGRAIARELGVVDKRGSSTIPCRVELPLITGRGKKKYRFSGDDLERILANEDAGLSRRRSGGRASGGGASGR